MYFQEGWYAANAGDYKDKENYIAFDKLFGANWQNQNQLIVDLYKLFKSEGATDNELDKEFFQFFESDGVDVYIANIDTEHAKQIVQKLQFVNSKFNDKYFVHNLYIANTDTDDKDYNDGEYEMLATEYICTINKNSIDK